MLLPVQSVGVMGDARTYDDVVAVRCVDTEDFMTADWCHLPYDLLAAHLDADHQRGAGREPRGLRHQFQAAGDDRVGVGATRYLACVPRPIGRPRKKATHSGSRRSIGQIGCQRCSLASPTGVPSAQSV